MRQCARHFICGRPSRPWGSARHRDAINSSSPLSLWNFPAEGRPPILPLDFDRVIDSKIFKPNHRADSKEAAFPDQLPKSPETGHLRLGFNESTGRKVVAVAFS